MELLKKHPPIKQDLTDVSRISKPKLSLKAAGVLLFLAGSWDNRWLYG